METSAAELRGGEDYDSLPEHEQALVRVAWNEQIAERLATLDLRPELQAAGVPWAEADRDGNLVMRHPLD